jgi:hypothetical protein
VVIGRLVAAALLAAIPAWCAEKYYTYVGNLAADSVLLAWGTANGRNTIGRSSPSHGEATVKINGHTLTSTQNWIVVGDLKPDTEYPYEISIKGSVIATNKFRTWAAASQKLAFFVIGDYGTGTEVQYQVAKAMLDEFTKRSGSDSPIRFILTTGDNIYGDISNFLIGVKNTGNEDADWAGKFFEPYQGLIAHVPFYATLGNHDGNESESHRDLPAYLDNFFFPNDHPARYYSFKYGGLAEFFALDSTSNTESGGQRPQFLESGPQWQWMNNAVAQSRAPWKIPYYHHPVFNAGPRHVASRRELEHWIRLFSRTGVKVVFNGHEHNFQFSEVNEASGGVRFVTSGAGGELRGGDVRARMRESNIAGWSAQNHFLVVEIDGKTMRITPVSWEPVRVVDAAGGAVSLPLVVTLP